jgi:hypothetical protein
MSQPVYCQTKMSIWSVFIGKYLWEIQKTVEQACGYETILMGLRCTAIFNTKATVR